MPGQGTILATGSMGYPAAFSAMPEEQLSALGISRVMNVSSTYDHRIIQGAESGSSWDARDAPPRGRQLLRADLPRPQGPVPPGPLREGLNPPSSPAGGTWRRSRSRRASGAHQRLPRRGHLVANLDPLGAGEDVPYHPDLDPHTYGFTIWDLDRFHHEPLGGPTAPRSARSSKCSGRPTAGTARRQRDRPESGSDRRVATPFPDDERKQILRKLIEPRPSRIPAHEVRRHKRFSLEGGESAIPLLSRLLDRCAAEGIREVVLGMSHRGR